MFHTAAPALKFLKVLPLSRDFSGWVKKTPGTKFTQVFLARKRARFLQRFLVKVPAVGKLLILLGFDHILYIFF